MKDKGSTHNSDREDIGRDEQENKVEAEISETDRDIEKVQVDLDKARSEATEYLENLQRLKADFDNFRKRMLREQSEILKMAAHEVIGALLPVIDDFERALAHEIDGNQVDEYKGGMQMVYGQLVEVLKKNGLVALEPAGEPFDPTKHEAIMKVASEEHPEGTVVKVVEKGYLLKDRVIRPAKVMVAGE